MSPNRKEQLSGCCQSNANQSAASHGVVAFIRPEAGAILRGRRRKFAHVCTIDDKERIEAESSPELSDQILMIASGVKQRSRYIRF